MGRARGERVAGLGVEDAANLSVRDHSRIIASSLRAHALVIERSMRAAMNTMRELFRPTKIGRRMTTNRIVMAPMTRSRADDGYIRTPGIATAEHVARWRRVTEAVHERGGLIFAQLCTAVGSRIHASFQTAPHPSRRAPCARTESRTRTKASFLTSRLVRSSPTRSATPSACTASTLRPAICPNSSCRRRRTCARTRTVGRSRVARSSCSTCSSS